MKVFRYATTVRKRKLLQSTKIIGHAVKFGAQLLLFLNSVVNSWGKRKPSSSQKTRKSPEREDFSVPWELIFVIVQRK
jgi:hypothetical protein